MGFPFDLEPASALYAGLFVLTLTAHLLCMHYVLAGTAVLAWRGLVLLRVPNGEKQEGPLVDVLRDWMPLALSATITVGVAPLLFLQILDPHSFYTANLLLGHRFGAILPALITGFYLLYVLKTKELAETHPRWRAALGVVIFLCFAFTGYTFAENHQLALARSSWARFFAEERFFFAPGAWGLRFLFWFGVAFLTLSWVLERQLGDRADARALRRMRQGGVAVGASALLGYGMLLAPSSRAVVLEGFGLVATLAIAAGLLSTFLPRGRFLGILLLVIAAVLQRERLRVHQLDWNALARDHASAAEVQGFFVFALFLVLNGVWIAWWVVRVRRDLRGGIS